MTVTLAATTDCEAAGAICTEADVPPSAAVTATVPRTVVVPTPFKVRLADMPEEHDGIDPVVLEVSFNKEPAGQKATRHCATRRCALNARERR